VNSKITHNGTTGKKGKKTNQFRNRGGDQNEGGEKSKPVIFKYTLGVFGKKRVKNQVRYADLLEGVKKGVTLP